MFRKPAFQISVFCVLLFAGMAFAQATLAQLKSNQVQGWSSTTDGTGIGDLFMGRISASKLGVAKSVTLTNPALTVDQNTASAVTGVSVTSAAAASGVTLGVTSSGTNEDLIIATKGSGLLSQRNGTNAQEFRVYNTFTDASNGEWGALRWNSNVLEIGANKNGSGTARNVTILSASTIIQGGGVTALTLNGSANAVFSGGTFVALGTDSYTTYWGTSTDCAMSRAAAGVLRTTTNTGTVPTWLQNTAGRARLTANATNATATLSNLTDLSLTVVAGRKYAGYLTVIAKNSTAAEGLVFDAQGGSATWTSFEWGFTATPPGSGLVLGAVTGGFVNSISVSTATTADAIYTIYITGVCNAGGTFIPRFSEGSHTSGTATVVLGSSLWLEDMPN